MPGKKPLWTPAETQFIRDNAGRLSDMEIANAIRRLTGRPVTPKAVAQHRARLGIAQATQRGRHWIRPKPTAPDTDEF